MQTSRRSILKGSILASLAGTMGATAMSASAAEKQAALPKKEYDLVVQSINTLSIKQMRTQCLQASISSGRSPVPHSLA